MTGVPLEILTRNSIGAGKNKKKTPTKKATAGAGVAGAKEACDGTFCVCVAFNEIFWCFIFFLTLANAMLAGGTRASGWPTAGTGRADFGLATPGARCVISSCRSCEGMGVPLVSGDITTPGCHRAQRRTHQGMVGNHGDHPSHHLCGGSCKWHSGAMKRDRTKRAGVDRRHREKQRWLIRASIDPI